MAFFPSSSLNQVASLAPLPFSPHPSPPLVPISEQTELWKMSDDNVKEGLCLEIFGQTEREFLNKESLPAVLTAIGSNKTGSTTPLEELYCFSNEQSIQMFQILSIDSPHQAEKIKPEASLLPKDPH